MKFTKMHGCGNDYIYVEEQEVKGLGDNEISRLARRMSDRKHGVGSDGLIIIAGSESADVRMIMYNSDGSRGKMCGNGIRCRTFFQLAEEAGFLRKLEEWVVWKAASDIQMLREKYPDQKLKISVNVTGTTIQLKAFESFLKNLADTYPVGEMGICIEITEQAALRLDDALNRRFHKIREMGYLLAVDDFSMGSTSIQYLTGSYFNLVKLDGSLVKGILDNPRCCEIISSIVRLTNSLDMMVLAEYVNDAAIQEKLLELGCEMYQGSYFSSPITLPEFEKLLEDN